MSVGSYTRIKVTDSPTVIIAPSGKFQDIGTVSGGVAQGTRSVNVWLNVTDVTGTLIVLLDSSFDGVNFSTLGANGQSAPITAPGLYQFGYVSATPGSIFRLTYALTGGPATIDVNLEIDSLS